MTLPDGSTIDDPKSTTRKLMAPPQANFKDVYAAGKAISSLSLLGQYDPAKNALQHFGTYDFQRDSATNIFYLSYKPAANYAVGVYMKGAGHTLGQHSSTRAAILL